MKEFGYILMMFAILIGGVLPAMGIQYCDDQVRSLTFTSLTDEDGNSNELSVYIESIEREVLSSD